MNMRVVLSALCLALAGGAGLSPAVSQEKPTASTTIDPRVQPLVGRLHNVTLELAREGWLTGVFGLAGGGRGTGSAERQIDFEKKK